MNKLSQSITPTFFKVKQVAIFITFLVVLGLPALVRAQTALVAGDVAIIACGPSGTDHFAIVLLKDIVTNTVINVTDNGFVSTTRGRTGEGFLTYTAPSAKCAGTVLVWTNGMSISGTGWSSNNPSNFSLNASGEQLFLFQGPTSAWGTNNQPGIELLYGVQTAIDWVATGNDNDNSTNPSNSFLPAAYRMNFTTRSDVYLNSTTLSGTPASIITSVTTTGNYTTSNGAVTFPSYSSFTVLADEPNTQASGITFPTVTFSSIVINWTNGNGTSRAVFVKQTTTGNAAPVDGTTYPANTTFGSGASQIGSTGWYCVYNGTGTSVTVNAGLIANTAYRVMVCEYKGASTCTRENYLTGAATGNPANVTTPSSNTITTSALGASSYCAGATGISVSFTYATAANFPTGGSCAFTAQLSDASGSFLAPINLQNINSNASGSQSISVTIPFTIAAGTGYRIRVVSNTPSVDGSDNGTNITIAKSTVSVAPSTTQNINASVNGTTITATEGSTASGRVWKYSTTPGIYNISTGVNASTYTPNFANPGTYYVACISTFGAPCNQNDTSNEVQINVTQANATSLIFSNACVTTADLSWTLPVGYVSGTNTMLVFAKQGAAITAGIPTSNVSTYTANANVNSGTVYQNDASARCVYKGDGTSVNLTGLVAGANYYFLVYNVIEPGTYSSGATQNGNPGTTQNVSSASANTSYGGAALSWTNPACFDEVIVVVNTTSGVGFTPTGDGTAYAANAYYTTINQTVFKGTGTTVDIANLTNGTTYYAEIFARKGTYWSSGVEVSIVPTATIKSGDIIFTQVSGDEDGFEFMTLKRLNLSGTKYTDQGICSSSRISTAVAENTSYATNVNSLTDIPAGTFVRVSLGNPGTNKSTTYDGWTAYFTGDGGGINNDGESIVCYSGSLANCSSGSGSNTYISGIHWGDADGWTSVATPDVHECKAPGTTTDFERTNTNGNIWFNNSVAGNAVALINSLTTSGNWGSYTVGSDFATDAKLKSILYDESNYASGSLDFSGVTTSGFTINWADAVFDDITASTRYAVVIYTNTASNAVDRYTCYVPNTAYGSAPSVVTFVNNQDGTDFCGTTTTGNGKVVYLGYGSSVAVTGLSAGTTYTVKIFAINGNGYTANYSSVPALGTETTIPADPTGTITQTNNCGNTVLHHANATYYWQGTNTNGTDNSLSVKTNNDFTASTSGIYYVRAYNAACNCWSTGSQSVSVTVKAIPADPTGTISQINNCGNTVLHHANAAYYWQGTNTSGTDNAAGVKTNNDFTANTSGTYYVRAYNATDVCWSTGSQSVSVTVKTIPADPTGAISQTNNCGNTVLHHANANYYWQGTNASGTDNAAGVKTNNDYTATTSGTYYIRAYNATDVCWSTGAQSVSVTVNAIPADPTGTITQTNNCGNTVLHHANANYYWQGTNVSGTDNASGVKTNNDYSATVDGTYYVRAYNSTGGCWSINSQNTVITVNAVPGNNMAQWLGLIDNNWNTAGNWCPGIPDSATDVVINSNAAYQPVITGTAYCRDIKVQNGAVATIHNHGHLLLYGDLDLTSTGTYTHTGGIIELHGAGRQTLPAITVDSMIINNGSGAKLGGTLTVKRSLNLLYGFIATDSNLVDVQDTLVTAITSGNDTSWVFGNLRRAVGDTGLYAFPVGDSLNLQYANVDMRTNSRKALGGIDSLTVYFNTDNSSCSEVSNGNGPYVNGLQMNGMLDGGFWTIHPDTGIYTGVTYNVTLKERGYTNAPASANDMAVIKRTECSSPWLSLGAHTNNTQAIDLLSGTATAVRSSLNSFSHFGIGFNGGTPLPVTIIYVEAEPVNNTYIRLQWATELEVNNYGFEIERSTDADQWIKVGFVEGHNNSTSNIAYSFDDAGVIDGVRYYYRLKQVDNNGNFEYTDIVTAILDAGSNFSVSDIYPNPAYNHTNLLIRAANDEEIVLDVYNLMGQNIMSKRQQIKQGENSIARLDFSDFASGTYSVIISSANSVYTCKVVIAR